MWYAKYDLEKVKEVMRTNMGKHLGLEITQMKEDALVGTMPVDHRTQQPLGILHGGASVVLAESLGSLAANLVLDPNKYIAVGLDINASHIKPMRSGYVIGEAKPFHIGRKTQVWDITITSPNGALVCSSRLTMSVLEKGNKSLGFENLLRD